MNPSTMVWIGVNPQNDHLGGSDDQMISCGLVPSCRQRSSCELYFDISTNHSIVYSYIYIVDHIYIYILYISYTNAFAYHIDIIWYPASNTLQKYGCQLSHSNLGAPACGHVKEISQLVPVALNLPHARSTVARWDMNKIHQNTSEYIKTHHKIHHKIHQHTLDSWTDKPYHGSQLFEATMMWWKL